jgi:spore germination protein YaaH
MSRLRAVLIAVTVTLLAPSVVAVASPSAGTPTPGAETGVAVTDPRAHVIFDDTHRPPQPNVPVGATATPLIHPRNQLSRSGPAAASPTSAQAAQTKRDPEVFGFAQGGEVTGGGWRSDVHLDLVSTVAYFGINIYGDGTLVTNDSGYQGYWSAQNTDLINAAHAQGVREVLVVKAMNNQTIATVTGSESNRQRLIANVVTQIRARGVDGVNLDFEGFDGSVAPAFTLLVQEIRQQLDAQIPSAAYITVDTYGSSAAGGTMMDISGLSPYVDAFMVMAYDMNSWSHASPTAPLNGYGYNDTRVVNEYLSRIPPSQLILGVPYYGYKWNVSSPTANAPTTSGGTADTYSGVLGDASCALQWNQHWDSTGAVPWASWLSPSSGDPCGGNHGSWREVYFDNATSLGYKYDLVNARQLRGIGIWALGYDGGSNDLWNEINAKFAVTHGPIATVAALPGTESSTGFQVCWQVTGASTHAILWVRDGGTPWTEWNDTGAACSAFTGAAGHSYTFWVQPFSPGGQAPNGFGAQGTATTAVSASAPSPAPFHAMYSLDGYGLLHASSSPPLVNTSLWRGWNIARAVALDGDGLGGQILDGFGGLHAFGNAPALQSGDDWPNWDIARDVVVRNDGAGGYVLDGFGGIHPFGTAPAVNATGYWAGWDIAKRLVLRPDGVSGYVLDGFGGLHPFAAAGVAMPAIPDTAYWANWDIARSVVLRADGISGYTLDGYGGIHPFGGAQLVDCACYWAHWDIARSLSLINGTAAGYLVDGNGGLHPFGGAPAVSTPFATALGNVRESALR